MRTLVGYGRSPYLNLWGRLGKEGALLLAAGELVGVMVAAVGQSHFGEQLFCLGAGFRQRPPPAQSPALP